VQRVPLVTLGAWTMLTPVFGFVFGWLLLGDQLATQAIGMALVLAALPVILLPARHRPRRLDGAGAIVGQPSRRVALAAGNSRRVTVGPDRPTTPQGAVRAGRDAGRTHDEKSAGPHHPIPTG